MVDLPDARLRGHRRLPSALKPQVLSPGSDSMLVNGKWSDTWQPVQAKDAQGPLRAASSSLSQLGHAGRRAGADGEGGFAAEAGRYRLYVALICPWASRTLIARTLKGLESAMIAVTVVEPKF